MDALCLFLRRHCYPCRYVDLVPLFGRSIPELCLINNTFNTNLSLCSQRNFNSVFDAECFYMYVSICIIGLILSECPIINIFISLRWEGAIGNFFYKYQLNEMRHG